MATQYSITVLNCIENVISQDEIKFISQPFTKKRSHMILSCQHTGLQQSDYY